MLYFSFVFKLINVYLTYLFTGQGLFATRDLDAGEFICEYAGQLLYQDPDREGKFVLKFPVVDSAGMRKFLWCVTISSHYTYVCTEVHTYIHA